MLRKCRRIYVTNVDARYSTERNEGFHSLKDQMARRDICWVSGWKVRMAIAILKVNEPHYWIELIIRGLGLLGHSISTPVMLSNGLQWIWIKNIKSRRKQLTDAQRKKRAKATQQASDAGKGSGYDFTPDRLGGAFS